jgi:hypothetical protein
VIKSLDKVTPSKSMDYILTALVVAVALYLGIKYGDKY